MLTFTASSVKNFKHTDKNLRWGQAFHQYMKLNMVNSDLEFCNKLYNEPDDKVAKQMVKDRTDKDN